MEGAGISNEFDTLFYDALGKLEKSGLRPGQTVISKSRVMEIAQNYSPTTQIPSSFKVHWTKSWYEVWEITIRVVD
ncbi:MAG: hypothetical protein E7263_04375 [Lachnospiraceae bacterium]|nr:hypothetical protein [Lachnospiraceae bacterium]